ncbi:MAG TPA: ABC transporter permease [bacterium]|nr:ABC transporter permease [bacterium]
MPEAAVLVGAPAGRARVRHRSWTRFLRRRTAVAGGFLALIFLGAMAGAGWIAPYPPTAVDYDHTLAPPSPAHPAGTDDFGRDILTRLIYGSRYSLGMGLGATCIGAVAGASWGIASAFYGGVIDNVSMRIVDVMLAFPGILLAIAIVAVLGVGMVNVIIAVGVYTVPTFARLVRGPVMAALNQEFVHAARAVGAGNARIMFRHLLPVALPSIIVYVTLRIGTAVLTAGSLSFLGLGVQPPTPEWGAMLAGARLFLNVAPHMVIAPGVAISLAVLGFNLLGDGMRDALDPRLRD